jgi:hypothetical protein
MEKYPDPGETSRNIFPRAQLRNNLLGLRYLNSLLQIRIKDPVHFDPGAGPKKLNIPDPQHCRFL